MKEIHIIGAELNRDSDILDDSEKTSSFLIKSLEGLVLACSRRKIEVATDLKVNNTRRYMHTLRKGGDRPRAFLFMSPYELQLAADDLTMEDSVYLLWNGFTSFESLMPYTQLIDKVFVPYSQGLKIPFTEGIMGFLEKIVFCPMMPNSIDNKKKYEPKKGRGKPRIGVLFGNDLSAYYAISYIKDFATKETVLVPFSTSRNDIIEESATDLFGREIERINAENIEDALLDIDILIQTTPACPWEELILNEAYILGVYPVYCDLDTHLEKTQELVPYYNDGRQLQKYVELDSVPSETFGTFAQSFQSYWDTIMFEILENNSDEEEETIQSAFDR